MPVKTYTICPALVDNGLGGKIEDRKGVTLEAGDEVDVVVNSSDVLVSVKFKTSQANLDALEAAGYDV